MTDLALYTVAVLSIAGLVVLGLHREQSQCPAAKLPAEAGVEAWLPLDLWDRAVVQPRRGHIVQFELRERDGYRPTLVVTDELADLAPYIEAHREALAELAAEAEVPMAFMDSPSVAQVADVLTATSRWVPPESAVFETHPTSPRVGDVAYGTVPEGCWKTVEAGDGYWPCNRPTGNDDLGLCATHRAELRSAS